MEESVVPLHVAGAETDLCIRLRLIHPHKVCCTATRRESAVCKRLGAQVDAGALGAVVPHTAALDPGSITDEVCLHSNYSAFFLAQWKDPKISGGRKRNQLHGDADLQVESYPLGLQSKA